MLEEISQTSFGNDRNDKHADMDRVVRIKDLYPAWEILYCS